MDERPLGPWADGSAAARGPVEPRPYSRLAGSAFETFADLELACAQRGLHNADDLEIWQIAAAFGIHRDDPTAVQDDAAARPASPVAAGPSPAVRPAGPRGVTDDPVIRAMLADHLRAESTGEKAQWQPTEAELIEQDRRIRGGG